MHATYTKINCEYVYSQTSLIRTHPLWMSMQIKGGNWINEGAVAVYSRTIADLFLQKLLRKVRELDIRGADK